MYTKKMHYFFVQRPHETIFLFLISGGLFRAIAGDSELQSEPCSTVQHSAVRYSAVQ